MGRIYVVNSGSFSVVGAQTLMRISAPTDAIVRVHEVKVTNLDQETSDQIAAEIRRVTTDGTNSITPTARPMEIGDAAFGGTVAADSSADPTLDFSLEIEGQNVLNGWHWLPTPEMRYVISPSGRIAVHLTTAPAGATNMNVMVKIEEIGG